jgi:Domain of unknown function (DUF4345)
MGWWLKQLLLVVGLACAAIGVFHFVLGVASVPGEATAGATVDSRERFYAAIFFGFGAACVWLARQSPIPPSPVRWAAGIFFAGGLGRVVSLAVHGRPHWFQVVLLVVELILPVVLFVLAGADARGHVPGRSRPGEPMSPRRPHQGIEEKTDEGELR